MHSLHFERVGPPCSPAAEFMSVMSAAICLPMSSPVYSTMSSARKTAYFFLLHKGSGAGLYVEHERIRAFGEFLALDRGADQIWTLDRAGDVAQGVQLAIRRSHFFGLANHGNIRKALSTR